MKRLLLTASMCFAAFLLVPVASATAEKTSGTCTFEGRATFLKTNLKPIPTPKLGYEFEGSAVCETLPGREPRRGTVEVKGEETLSCAGSLGEGEGKGTLTLGGIKIPFGLTFYSGAPGVTALAAKFLDGGVAVGSATFLTSRSQLPSECFALEGAHTLEFTAAAVGEL
jgi:hypothetical protein